MKYQQTIEYNIFVFFRLISNWTKKPCYTSFFRDDPKDKIILHIIPLYVANNKKPVDVIYLDKILINNCA